MPLPPRNKYKTLKWATWLLCRMVSTVFTIVVLGYEAIRQKKLENIIWWCSRVGWVRPVTCKQFLRFSILLLAETYTVAQAVDTFGFGRFQVKLSLFTGLCWMADSMETTILSILSPTLQYEWQITLFQQALATTVSLPLVFN